MSEIIDLKDFMERVQDDKELLLELLDIFQEDFVIKRQALQTAVSASDIAKIKEVAHSLKGASGNISAKEMHANFLKIEQAVKVNDLGQLGPILQEVDTQFELIKKFAAQLKKDFAS
ncbi:MAG: Hpt domain-containing protein [Candidatus Omnitrophica bacterium]|nr:Hpt domain-containing protein [Candidatus Omnitrophota bacterium]